MKLSLKSGNGLVVIVLAVAVLAVAFWMLLLGPKREEATKLGAEVEQVEASLAQHSQEAAFAAEARESFPDDYRRLVVLGKAVPGDDDTASFLVQVNRIAESAGVEFRALELSEGSGGAEATPPPAEAAASTGTPVSATEAAASVLPLGATVGPAGLAVMPYTLTFDGSFFEIADFIKGMDKLVDTKEGTVAVDGRLVTIDGFDLSAAPSESFPALEATFTVTTYLTPPSQGATGGATLESPPASSAAPVATTTGGAP
jgi:Tfp pilus assembly protein PilO